jgi:flagellar basal-body rod modification protein FlgD
MIDTNTLTSVLGQGSVVGAAKKAAGTISSQDQFLTLMLAQLKNQDPMKPLEPAQFLGQLAQFSTVTGIQDMKSSVADLSQSLRSAQLISGTGMVGHSILSATSAVNFDGSTAVSASAGSPSGTTQIQVSVRDSSGALVRRFQVTPHGDFTDFSWDGRTDTGVPAAAGAYKLDAVGLVNGKSQSLEMLTPSRVNSVTIDPQGTGLILNTSAGSVALGDVRRVM